MSREPTERAGRSLMSEFSDVYELGCSEQSDKVSNSMNISGFQLCFRPKEKTADESRWILVMTALSAGDATALGGIDDLLMLDDDPSNPSWLNRANDREDTMIAIDSSRLQEPTCIASIDHHQITLDVLRISDFAFKEPSLSSYALAFVRLDFVSQRHSKKAPADQPFWMVSDPGSIENQRERYFVAEILPCSFERGVGWIMKQMNFLPRLAEYIQTGLDRLEYDFWPLIRDVLVVGELVEPSYLDKFDEEQSKSLLQYFYLNDL